MFRRRTPGTRGVRAMFAEVLDLTIVITLAGLGLTLGLFLLGRVTEQTWVDLTRLLYEGGLMRMWALVAAGVIPAVVKEWFDGRSDK